MKLALDIPPGELGIGKVRGRTFDDKKFYQELFGRLLDLRKALAPVEEYVETIRVIVMPCTNTEVYLYHAVTFSWQTDDDTAMQVTGPWDDDLDADADSTKPYSWEPHGSQLDQYFDGLVADIWNALRQHDDELEASALVLTTSLSNSQAALQQLVKQGFLNG